jgi:long-chain acyl-CoA synthetase
VPQTTPSNLADLVRAAAGRADAPALLWQHATITWSELDAEVDAIAAGLTSRALPDSGGHAARVAIVLPNVPEFAAVYFGVLRAGLVAVAINTAYTPRELRHVLADSGASLVVGEAESIAAIESVRDQLPDLRETHVGPAELAIPDAGAPPTDRGGEDLAVLLYTSGTAGAPKGAMLSHRALLANHAQLAAIEPPPIGADDVLLLAVPFFHAYGLNSGLGAIAYHGASGVLMERFDPMQAAELVARHHVTAIVGVPGMYQAWSLTPDVAEAFASVRLAVSGAAPLDRGAAHRFLEATRHPIFEGYGLTETAPVLASTLVSPVPKSGSIGRPIPGVEIKLISAAGAEIWRAAGQEEVSLEDDSDDFETYSPDSPGTDPGEIVARGDNLFSGYWPDGSGGPDADGWWSTGDVAYADADGDLFLVDRLTEVILVNGFNVYPHEVELVLMAHPDVAEAAVIGVPHPFTGQTVKAFVVTKGPVTTEELLAHCERNLARFKCPTAFDLVSELPHTATGKVRKVALRD